MMDQESEQAQTFSLSHQLPLTDSTHDGDASLDSKAKEIGYFTPVHLTKATNLFSTPPSVPKFVQDPPPTPDFPQISSPTIIQIPTEDPKRSGNYNSNSMGLGPLMALDPYSIPISPLLEESSPNSKRPVNFFEGGPPEFGPAFHASDLAHDDAAGLESSSPFTAFTSSTVMQQKIFTNTPSLGFGALLNPFRDSVIRPPTVSHAPLRCYNCGGYSNIYSPIASVSGDWKCVFCGKGNDSPEGEYLKSPAGDNIQSEYSSVEETGLPLSHRVELFHRVVDYKEGSRIFSSAADTALGAPLIILLDENLKESSVINLKDSLLKVLESVPVSTRVALVTFGKSVSVFDLQLSSPSSSVADSFPANVSLAKNPEVANELLYGQGVYLLPVSLCGPTLQFIFSSLRSRKSPEVKAHQNPRKVEEVALHRAIEIALALVRGPGGDLPREPVKRSGGSSRVLVVMGGNSQGSGPVQEMFRLGREGKKLETQVDIFWVDEEEERTLYEGNEWLESLLMLTKESGGLLIRGEDWDSVGRSIVASVGRSVGVKGKVEVRTMADVRLDWVVGPAEEAGRGSVSGESSFVNDKGHKLDLSTVEEGIGLGFGFSLSRDLKKGEGWIYFQFVINFIGLDQAEILRVITLRLRITDDLSEYLQSVDDEVAAVLAAKRSILATEKASDVKVVKKMIEKRVQDIATKLGIKVPRSRMTRFPNELPRLPEFFYHLKSSPFLEGDEGRRLIGRALFLRADLDLSLRLLAPQLLVYRPSLGMQEVPPYTLALHHSNALLMDHGTYVLVWLGKVLSVDQGRSEEAENMCLAAISELTHNRFPVPQLVLAKEGSSASKHLETILVPAHKDSLSDQETRFPFLRELLPEEKSQLRAHLSLSQRPSYCQWMKSLSLIPPDPIPLK